MIEKIIKKDNRDKIYLKYDKEKYNIEYVKNKNIIILRRLSDNKIIEIFSDKIGFIVQCDLKNQTNFLVTDYGKKDSYGNTLYQFIHYTDRSYLDSLQLEESFDCEYTDIYTARITDSSYQIRYVGRPSYIYNLNEVSKEFCKIYNDQKVKDFFNDNTLLVSEKQFANLRHEVNDTLTYGINPETYEITTPIWSELQQRFINVYTQEEVDRLREELSKKGLFLNRKDLGEITIYFEVKRYLNEIAKHIDEPQSIYKDVLYSEVNEEFVKKFIKK